MRTLIEQCVIAVFIVFLASAIVRPQRRIDDWEALERSLKTAKSIQPKDGFVPDESTAIKIAEAVAIAQYGEKRISQERPFRARLLNGVWTAQGTLHPGGVFGGTAVVQIRKADGTIVFLTHQE